MNLNNIKNFAISVVLLVLVVFATMHITAPVAHGPYVTWAAMQRLWNKISPKNLEIVQVETAPDGYLVVFAPALIMNVVMMEDQIRSLRLQYDSVNDPGGSGQFFLQCVTTAFRVGSYSWPPDEREKGAIEFEGISPQKVSYSYAGTTFTRQAFPGGMWEFFMEYDLPPGK